MRKVILVASGKGGTGKTSLTAAVGTALAEMGKKVLVIDGDCGLRNLDLVLGMSELAVFTFADVARGSDSSASLQASICALSTARAASTHWASNSPASRAGMAA